MQLHPRRFMHPVLHRKSNTKALPYMIVGPNNKSFHLEIAVHFTFNKIAIAPMGTLRRDV